MAEKVRVKWAADCPPCPDCGEPFCEECNQHYADCDCLGPCQAEDEGYELDETGQYATKKEESNDEKQDGPDADEVGCHGPP
jgi:hypothetical protein